jgi:hypothetical protein
MAEVITLGEGRVTSLALKADRVTSVAMKGPTEVRVGLDGDAVHVKMDTEEQARGFFEAVLKSLKNQ